MPISSGDSTTSETSVAPSEARHETLSEAAPPSDASSQCSEVSTVSEDEEIELSEIEGYDDVDVGQLCALPITDQQRIVERVKQIEADRSTEELFAANGNPEAFSALSTREFLREAQFDIKVQQCREQFTHGQYNSSSESSRVRRIATDSTRRFIFEKGTDQEPEQSMPQSGLSTDESRSALGPSIGRMMPGESILDGCLRLKRERTSAAKTTPLTSLNKKQNISRTPRQEVEWEELSGDQSLEKSLRKTRSQNTQS